MAYSAGLRDKRITIMKPAAQSSGEYGVTSSSYTTLMEVWASMKWTKGMKPMQEGAMEAYDVYMVRCAYHPGIDADCRIQYDGKVYQIDNIHTEKRANEIQMICTEIAD